MNRFVQRLRARTGGDSGATLIEVVIVTGLVTLILVPLFSWSVVAMGQQADSKVRNQDTSGLNLANLYFVRDVRNAMAAASEGTGALKDCTGGDGAGGEVKVALITAAKRRITYVLENGRLWRRECTNLSAASDATLGDPSRLNLSSGATGVVDGPVVELAGGIESIAASCPTADGAGADPECRTVSMVVAFPQLQNGRQLSRAPVNLVGSRRVTVYRPPGAVKPVARFRYYMADPATYLPAERQTDVTFDGGDSRDLDTSRFPAGEPISSYRWVFTRIVDNSSTILESVTTSTPTYTRQFDQTGTWRVSLVVTSMNGESVGYERDIQVVPRRPRGRQDVDTLTVSASVQDGAFSRVYTLPFTTNWTIFGDVAPTEDDGSNLFRIVKVRWDWGDGTFDQDVELVGQPLPICQNSGICEVSASHAWYSEGDKVVRLTLTDARGTEVSRTFIVKVRPDSLYVTTGGTDSGLCGAISAPCRTIQQAVDNAAASSSFKNVRVGPGTFTRFRVRNGVGVEGGWTNDFTSRPMGTTTKVVGSYGFLANGFGDASYAISADDLTQPTMISGIQVEGEVMGEAVTVTGTARLARASYGVVVRYSGTNLTLKDMTIIGGRGERGASGENGAYGGLLDASGNPIPATAGERGWNSLEKNVSCSTERRSGGAGANVGVASRNGGAGGQGGQMDTSCGFFSNYTATAGLAGAVGGGGVGGAGGGGGAGATSGNGARGTNGSPGANGTQGTAGAAGSAAFGVFFADALWEPANLTTQAAGNGQEGALSTDPGRGGGGGGGGGGSDEGTDDLGGGGGGGGAGGVPASVTGKGGRAGGATITLHIVNSTPTLVNVTVRLGAGGQGGNGGAAGPGQPGGAGGGGGVERCNSTDSGTSASCSQSGNGGGGGNGGSGGAGGASGPGGGGAGGPVFGIVRLGSTSGYVNQGLTFSGGTGGVGGAGGTGSNGLNGPTGVSGIRQNEWAP